LLDEHWFQRAVQRLYGPTHPFYDGSWIPGDVIKLA
jgi:hypothetical protein